MVFLANMSTLSIQSFLFFNIKSVGTRS